MKTHTHTQTNISIAFCGKFRPLHVESDSMQSAIKSAMEKINCEEIRAAVQDICKDYARQRKAGIGIVSACKENYRFSVRIAEGKRDNWLDSLTDEMPHSPLVNY